MADESSEGSSLVSCLIGILLFFIISVVLRFIVRLFI